MQEREDRFAVNDKRSMGWSRRRLIGFAGLAGILAVVAQQWPTSSPIRGDDAQSDAATVHATLIAFIGSLFGRVLSPLDVTDLSERLDYLLGFDGPLVEDCRALASYLDHLAAEHGRPAFKQCERSSQELIVDQVMRIDVHSIAAHLAARLSASYRAYYRMRWSAIPQLAWLYRHSPAAWRARGYTRWAGVAGDWREVLNPGPPYP
jgi:hypothetical protein